MEEHMQTNPIMGAMDWTMLVLLSVLWSFSFFFVEIAISALPPLTVVWIRVALAALALSLFVRFAGIQMPFGGEIWKAFFGMGILNNLIPFSLIVWGQTQITSGQAGILMAMTPIMTVIVAHFLTRNEKMTWLRLSGVLIGFGGVFVMIGPDSFAGAGFQVLGQLAVVGATLSYGFAGVFGLRFKRLGANPVTVATGQLIASSILLLPLVLLIDKPWTLALPSLSVWAALVGLALLSTAIAYIIFFRILLNAGATNAVLVTFLVPVGAVCLGWAFLGESLEPRHFGAMALIALSLTLVDGRLPRRLRKSFKTETPAMESR